MDRHDKLSPRIGLISKAERLKDWIMNRLSKWGSACAILLLALAGCIANRGTSLQISGTPGAQFTAKYRSAQLYGDITTHVEGQRPAIVLEAPGDDTTFDVSKKDPDTSLTVNIVKNRKVLYTVNLPPGTQGTRITKTASGWEQTSH